MTQLELIYCTVESTLLSTRRSYLDINLVCSFPFVESFSLELVGFATLLCVSTTLNEMRINLAWLCFDVKLSAQSGTQ
jgi:hypothetical protein